MEACELGDTLEVFVKKYLEQKLSQGATTSQGKRTDLGENHVGVRQIREFLSKEGEGSPRNGKGALVAIIGGFY